MRKLAYFLFAVLIIALGWSIAAWLSPDIKTGSESLFRYLLGSGWIIISGAWTELMTVASTNGTNFLIYTLSVLIFAVFFWAGMRRLWTHRPHLPSRVKTSASSTASTLASSTGIRSSTPAGATTRPAKTSQPTDVEPEPEAVTEKVTENEQTTS